MSIKLQRFFFVRHGTTDWNLLQRCQGQTDIPLNEQGRNEAIVLGQHVKKYRLTGVFSSPLQRAVETAKIAFPSSTLTLVDDLKERGWGQIEGISSQEMYRIEQKEEQDPLFEPGHGVEPRSQLKARIVRGIHHVLENGDQSPVIVSHGRLFLVLCEVLNVPLIRQIDLGALIECAPEGTKWKIVIHPKEKGN